MDGLENLLATYAGAVALNAGISALLWWNNRQPLFQNLFLVWLAHVVAFAVQGAFREGDLVIIMAFSSVFFIAASLARLFDSIQPTPIPWRLCGGLMVVSIGAALGAAAAGAPFTVVALPICLGAPFPATWVVFRAVASGSWRQLTLAGRGLLVTMALEVLHTWDFAFLRNVPEFGGAGFTIALLVVFALSIFAPATVLEIVTERQARAATEMLLARRIQMEILPKEPRIDGLEISAFMQPAEEVGGDYYDVYTFGGHSWVLLGDVTGHGLSSGLVMLMAQSVIASILHTRPEISPAELSFTANHILFNQLRRLGEQRTMTLVAISRDGADNSFRFSGNHENLYVFRHRAGSVEVLDVEHIPHGLGMLDEFGLDAYTQDRFSLEEGDLLFLASDGIREAAAHGDYEQGMFGEERMLEILTRSAARPLADIKKSLLEELERFTGGVYHDDISFLIARATR